MLAASMSVVFVAVLVGGGLADSMSTGCGGRTRQNKMKMNVKVLHESNISRFSSTICIT